MSDHGDGYLWDRSGEPDPDVAALEQLLGRYAQTEGAPTEGAPTEGATTAKKPRRWSWRLLALPLAAALVVIAWVFWPDDQGPRVFTGEGIRLAVTDGRLVEEDNGFRAATASTLELVKVVDGEDEWIGDFTFEPGSRAQVDTLTRDVTRLALREGRLEAMVSADARPRFFQVDTPSGRCIDLGCEYSLDVDEAGDAHIVVTLGQVAFTNVDGRERYVPEGAECRATRALGLGTPRFAGVTEGFDARLDTFDAAAQSTADERRTLATRMAEAAAAKKDTLALWHLLDDADRVVRAVASAALARIAGTPPVQQKVIMKGAVFSREEWREHLEELWW